MDKDKILIDRPFLRFLDIKEIQSLEGHGAISGETYCVLGADGHKYKLRLCSSLEQAKRIEKNVALFKSAFPKFYGREDRYVLFDWLEGQSLYDMLTKPIPLEVFYQIGELVGEAHALNDVDTTKSADSVFQHLLKEMRNSKKFNEEMLADIKEAYNKMRTGLKVDIVLEINDIHARNFIVQNSEDTGNVRVYFVDEDGFGHKIKGIGLAKPFFIEGLIKTHEQQNMFWKGYNEHHSSDYFDKQYQEFVTFMQILRSINVKLERNLDISKHMKLLEKYI